MLSAAPAAALPDGPPAAAAALRAVLPQAQPAGRGHLSWFGLRAYEARLWVEPPFRHGRFEDHAFALELTYAMEFGSLQIARRSLEEMRRGGPLPEAEAQRWEAALHMVLPDVRPGDRITGIHRPGRGALFQFNGRTVGAIEDPAFARRFFGIWLAPTTSQPRLREALLAGTAP
jgi:hypothetical protein